MSNFWGSYPHAKGIRQAFEPSSLGSVAGDHDAHSSRFGSANCHINTLLLNQPSDRADERFSLGQAEGVTGTELVSRCEAPRIDSIRDVGRAINGNESGHDVSYVCARNTDHRIGIGAGCPLCAGEQALSQRSDVLTICQTMRRIDDPWKTPRQASSETSKEPSPGAVHMQQIRFNVSHQASNTPWSENIPARAEQVDRAHVDRLALQHVSQRAIRADRDNLLQSIT